MAFCPTFLGVLAFNPDARSTLRNYNAVRLLAMQDAIRASLGHNLVFGDDIKAALNCANQVPVAASAVHGVANC